ncbi:MAG: glycosyltransferase family 4 protein [Candidatus Limnocylindria bacterium]
MTEPTGAAPLLHVVTSTQRRGAETFAVDLAEALRSRGVGSEVVALAPGSAAPTLDVPALGRRALAPATLRALRRRADGTRLVIAHGSRTLPACATALAGRRTPIVYRSIGDPAAWSPEGLRRFRTAMLLRRMTAVTVLWPGSGETLLSVHGVPADRIHVIPNGVPAARCPVPNPDASRMARSHLGLRPGDAVVAYIGALGAEKRVGDAIDAVRMLPGVHLLVAGDGPERLALERRAAETVPAQVHFTGVLEGPTEALAAADVVVLPSHTEGMPGVLIEAGLAATPAVATDVGGVSEIVRDGETGVLVRPGDVAELAAGLSRALAEQERLGSAARQHCMASFEIGPVADRWVALANQLAPTPHPGS